MAEYVELYATMVQVTVGWYTALLPKSVCYIAHSPIVLRKIANPILNEKANTETFYCPVTNGPLSK